MGARPTLDKTISREESAGVRNARPEAASLVVVLQCDLPRAGSSRHALEGVRRVVIGRASAQQVARSGETLELRIPDQRMSLEHAHLVLEDGQWQLEDAHSRNGSFRNGSRCRRAALEDGDLIELGHTFLLFREARAVDQAAGGPLDLTAGELPEPLPGLRTFSPAFAAVLSDLAAVAGSGVSVLLQGESGTGKELCAHAIHERSGRRGAFVPVNCGALPDALVTSELFGYLKGAFSGATQDRVGLVRSAHEGTLFLDEIAELPLASQAVLLRVLQEREVTPLGATRAVPVDLQVVAATHRDVGVLLAREVFRHDLYARVAGFTAHVPPLRERREDLGLLIPDILSREGEEAGAGFAWDAARALVSHDWPLNVRELEACLTVASRLARGGPIELRHLPDAVRHPASAQGAEPEPDQLPPADRRRRSKIIELLREHAGNVSAVARAAGWNRVQVHRWIRRYRLDPRQFRQ